ncbi:MAG: formate dehydrogenase accessory sulfurtransferase FdhD [Actinomycetota bacterium]|nr:formate dehydrogenase accessory sulfurtransferase FdhD [Actinomycetota bacterium]
MTVRPGRTTRIQVWAVQDGRSRARRDALATEEPLEIRVAMGHEIRSVAVTMRTPGDDFELAVGFLHGEGVITGWEAVERVSYCLDASVDVEQRHNIVTVSLAPGIVVDLRPLERHFVTTSACGVCGKAALEALAIRACPKPPADLRVDPAVLLALPERLRAAQAVFEATGGLHAAGLFTLDGHLLALREDVGRHNALDKLVGWALLERRLPLDRHLMLVSGRASYELLQKGVAAGTPIVCSVSAPSSLAVDVARRFGVTLVSFLRDGRFNVYAGVERIQARAGQP